MFNYSCRSWATSLYVCVCVCVCVCAVVNILTLVRSYQKYCNIFSYVINFEVFFIQIWAWQVDFHQGKSNFKLLVRPDKLKWILKLYTGVIVYLNQII